MNNGGPFDSEHGWNLVVGWQTGPMAVAGNSKDTLLMCSRCGCVKHDYEPDSPNYPRYFWANGGERLSDSAVAPHCVPVPWRSGGADDHEDREPIMPGDYRYYDVRGQE